MATDPMVEAVAARVHADWMDAKRRAGVSTRCLDTTGEELMVPYEALSEEAKELDRGTVRCVLASLTPALRDVMAERLRQREVEGWSDEHDDCEHEADVLAAAAACYATPAANRRMVERADRHEGRGAPLTRRVPNLWPWSVAWWKPTPRDRRRELVKAGALILAEIERLDRAEAPDA